MPQLRSFWYPLRISQRLKYSAYSSSNQKHEHFRDTSISEAERVVGYPTSFLNLRWLLSEEIAHVASHLRKLLGTNHPLQNLARDLILNSEKPSWGLIVLLVSKAGGHIKSFTDIDQDKTAGVLHSQRIVGEVTEMLKTSNLLHRTLITIDDNTKDVPNMRFGNKVALLCGDYLLSNSYQQLASIKDHDLNDLISSAVRDLAESEFIGVRDKNNKPLPSKPTQENTEFEIPAEFGIRPSSFTHFLGNAKTEWILRSTLSGASLLGKACKGVLLLAGHDEDFQMKGFLLGKYLALSLEAARDYTSVFSDRKISPISAPMLFHLQRYPTFYSTIERVINNESNFDDSDIRSKLQKSVALSDTILLQNEFSEKTLSILEHFRDSDAKIALRNIIHSIKLEV